MQLTELSEEARRFCQERQARGERVALVPTMGALHSGHLSLVEAARKHASSVILSIFVNPTQFGPGEDFERYPRTWESDQELARDAGVDLLFHPSVDTLYPKGAATWVEVENLGNLLCGAFRPGHFRGVTTVVAKLFHIAPADFGIFGEKDYQQLTLIRRMAHDLHFPIQIVGVPTLREADGLALSSRNRYLSASERALASQLPQALFAAQALAHAGEIQAEKLADFARSRLGMEFEVQYLTLVDAQSLEEISTLTPGRAARLLVAAYLGKTRLIDNVEI